MFVSGTIADNLRLAAPGTADERLWEALRRVALEERVRSLPDGLGTPLGEDGTTLSAGERARLALARVLLSERPWVLLDEPTAHLDALTEQVVADTVRELGQSRSVVVVAHRPALVALADEIVALPAPTVPEVRDATPTGAVAARPLEPDQGPERRRGLLGPTVLGGLASASGVALTATAGWLIVQASTRPPVLTLLVAIVAVRAFGLARPVLRYVERLRSHDVVLGLLAERRVEVYDAVVPLTPGALGRRRGDVLASVVDDVDSVLDRELRVRMPVRGFAITGVIATLVAALIEPAAALPVALTCVVGGGVGYLLARSGAARAEARAVHTRARLSEAVVEVTQTAAELTMWQAEDAAVARVGAISDELGRASIGSARWLASGRALALLVSGLGVAATALLVTPAVASASLSAPMAALLVLLPLALGEVSSSVADAGALAARTRVAQQRLTTLATRPPAVTEPAVPVAVDSPGVAVDDVAAGWDGHVALSGLSVTLAPGERVAVVGPTGSGKSTLAALLLRFIDPISGRVELGSHPLPEIALDDVRRTVGLVDDDPHIFATTLAENVRLARPGASDAEVEEALRRARLGGWLDGLPDGLGSWLGDGHAGVSGGERARVAIARSLLADQPVLVLDEPAAHLDRATGEELAAEVLDQDPDRAVLWITHTDTGLDRVDRVVALG